MDTLKNISMGVILGFWDSVKGMTLVLHIDNEIHRINEAKEAERLLRQQYRHRTPSPAPSSASAMMREEREKEIIERKRASAGNPDERSLESIRKQAQQAAMEKPKYEKKVAKQILKCCLLNGGFTWLSIILFEQLLLPMLKLILSTCYGGHTQEFHIVWSWLQSILSILFGMMWVLPIFLLSKIVSSLWFADIANAAYKVRKGRPQLIPNISKLVADFLFSLVVQALFLVQTMLVDLIPILYIGRSLSFVHLCLLYSLYCFEYKWFNMGWELHRRLSYIENNWPYFIGFGIPLTILTNLSSSIIVSSCIFSIFFPLFILSGNEAKPLVGTTETSLRLFSPVIFASNLFFRGSGERYKKQVNAKATQQQQQQQKEYNQQMPSKLNEQTQTPQLRQRDHRSQQQPQQYQPLYRYNQPLQKPVTTRRRSSPESMKFNGGMRPLIPTPVPGAPPSRTSSTSSSSSFSQYR